MSLASHEPLFLGVDFGTSGVRGSVINLAGDELARHAITLTPNPVTQGHSEETRPQRWREALVELLSALDDRVDISQIAALSIDGTSSTVLLCDSNGEALSPALMYNDSRAREQAQRIAELAPERSGAHGASSSLAKVLYLKAHYPDIRQALICHQADWIQTWLTGKAGVSDENNCLKLGYDSLAQQWPDWISKTGIKHSALPEVLAPGHIVSTLNRARAAELALNPDCLVVSGTTDSIAALIASGACEIGDAVTALGSTLVLKLISSTPVFAAEYGVYSHKLGSHWLVGGASNSGGQVLSQFFSQQQLDDMTPQLKPEQLLNLNYYPLPTAGERFPLNAADKKPRLTPRPEKDLDFFQAILEGIADIEAEGYDKLQQLGASQVKRIYTSGGGSRNHGWRRIRERKLNMPILNASNCEASFGSALLARQGWQNK